MQGLLSVHWQGWHFWQRCSSSCADAGRGRGLWQAQRLTQVTVQARSDLAFCAAGIVVGALAGLALLAALLFFLCRRRRDRAGFGKQKSTIASDSLNSVPTSEEYRHLNAASEAPSSFRTDKTGLASTVSSMLVSCWCDQAQFEEQTAGSGLLTLLLTRKEYRHLNAASERPAGSGRTRLAYVI